MRDMFKTSEIWMRDGQELRLFRIYIYLKLRPIFNLWFFPCALCNIVMLRFKARK